jgi:hypothetical protein
MISVVTSVPGMATTPYEARLGLENLETRRVGVDMHFVYKILFGIVDIDHSKMFNLNTTMKTRGQNYNLSVQISRLESQKHCTSNTTVETWNSLLDHSEHSNQARPFNRYNR